MRIGRRRELRVIPLAMAGVCLFVVCGESRAVEAEYPVGVRAMGMGGVGVASAERPEVVSRNPGSVVRLEQYAAELFTASLYGLIRANYLSGVLPLSERRALGFDWLRIDFTDDELAYAQNRLRLGYAFRPAASLSLGFGVNYRTARASLDGTVLGSAAGWSTDGGLVWSPPFVEGFATGVSVRNWYSATPGGKWRPGAWIQVEEGSSQPASSRVVTWGAQYRRGRFLVAAETDDAWKFGVEAHLTRRLWLRTGVSVPRNDGVTFSFGLSGSWKAGTLDYAFVVPPTLPPTSYFGLTFGWSYRIPPVIIEGVALANLYPALREYYARSDAFSRETFYTSPSDVRSTTTERIGEVWLYNPGVEPVRVSVRLWMERFTSRRGTEAVESVEIPAGSRVVVPLRKVLLSDASLALTENRPVEVRVEVADVRNEARRRAVASANLLLYGRNEIRLDDVGKLAAFVTPTNRVVRRFAEATLHEADAAIRGDESPMNLLRAVALFSALSDVAYTRDPNLPRESGTIDAIRYPAELLERLRSGEEGERPVGDCDDSTVLVCALLEAAGISTALLQTPGHVLMAFDPGGVTLEEAQKRGWDEYTVPIDGYAWVPLETTSLGKGFAAAWQEGLEQVRFGVLNSITTRVAWERYGNVNPKLSAQSVTVSREALLSRLEKTVTDKWFLEATRAWRKDE